MINFPCKCGEPFSLPEDQAGGLVQCPVCGLLADVPTLGDLQHLNSDGTIAFEQTPDETPKTSAAVFHRSFIKNTKYSDGSEKDLRNPIESINAVGSQEQIKARPAPRYDPATGELIRPLELKDEKPTPVLSIGTLVDPDELDSEPAEIPLPVVAIPPPRAVASNRPIPKPRALTYALGEARKQVTVKTLGLELLMPANATVMFFIFVLYVIGYFMTDGIASFTRRFFPPEGVWPFALVNFTVWLVLAHLGCVIEDTGPDAIDELPRPFRNFSPGEDVFVPLFRTALAFVLCYWPMVVLIRLLDHKNPATVPIILIFGLIGSYLMPAVLLTAVTGTTILNLSIDRVLAVIKLSGAQYILSVFLFVAMLLPSVYFLIGNLLLNERLTGPFFTRIQSFPLMMPLMLLSVYLLHLFGWHLGMIYRAHHDEFPWLAQRHIKAERSKIQIHG